METGNRFSGSWSWDHFSVGITCGPLIFDCWSSTGSTNSSYALKETPLLSFRRQTLLSNWTSVQTLIIDWKISHAAWSQCGGVVGERETWSSETRVRILMGYLESALRLGCSPNLTHLRRDLRRTMMLSWGLSLEDYLRMLSLEDKGDVNVIISNFSHYIKKMAHPTVLGPHSRFV